MEKIIIGQEAICPDGLGRVEAFDLTKLNNWIKVKTYINNRGCKWDVDNVELISHKQDKTA